MRLPSLQHTVRDAVTTVKRFPLPLVSAFVGTIAALILMDHEGTPAPTRLWGLLFGGILGIPLLTACTLFAERRMPNATLGWALRFAVVLLLVGYVCSVPGDLTNAPEVHGLRLLLLVFAAHMLVAFAAFTSRNEENGYWQFNKTLLLRVLVAIFFALVIYAGLAFALAALDNLFAMKIQPKRYAELWVFVIGAFTPCFFLAGVPDNLAELEHQTDYPKGIKVFAQYVLLPIVGVYLVILYAYMAKILMSWDWPQGWVSKLILGFSGLGILSILLLHPLANQSENSWIPAFRRWYYISLIPLTVMFFLAVGRRVDEYAITEGRYLAFGVGAWLVITIVYFLILPKKNIKFYPASLCLATLLMCYGPWGLFSVAEQSQASRLESLLRKNGILVDGRIKKTEQKLPGRDAREISAILNYLHEIHGYEAIQPWFDRVLRVDSTKAGVGYVDPSQVAAMMGVGYRLVRPEPDRVIYLAASRDSTVDIHEYANLVPSRYYYSGTPSEKHRVGDIRFYTTDSLNTLTIVAMKGPIPGDSIKLDVRAALAAVLAQNDSLAADHISPASMSVSGASGRLRAKFCLAEARMERTDKEIRVLNFTGDIIYTIEGEK